MIACGIYNIDNLNGRQIGISIWGACEAGIRGDMRRPGMPGWPDDLRYREKSAGSRKSVVIHAGEFDLPTKAPILPAPPRYLSLVSGPMLRACPRSREPFAIAIWLAASVMLRARVAAMRAMQRKSVRQCVNRDRASGGTLTSTGLRSESSRIPLIKLYGLR